MPVIIGTAGHIDHGKAALVRMLTGQETDRLTEEKERGISIDLGFAYFDADGIDRAGVVDVPGHERFIRNMLAGAHGVDLVLFAVAADDGVMPQTQEHLDILHLLGVRRGVFVITKTDLVDATRVAVVREEIEVLAVDTSLEGAPILPVSTVTGEGLNQLRRELTRQLVGISTVKPSGYFRLPVDRAFVMHGHGVVVTGTAVAGSVQEGDALRILPGNDMVRVRHLEVHGETVAGAQQGQRIAMNLAGVERSDIGRGHVVCDPRLSAVTTRLDARMEIRPAAQRALKSHARVRFHLGAAEVLAKVVVLDDASSVAPRASAFVQIVLGAPVLALRGDRFVLRDETARWTWGGGVVLNPFADRHRAGDRAVREGLEALHGDDPRPAARAFLELTPTFACERWVLAQGLNLDEDDIATCLANLDGVLSIPDGEHREAYTTQTKWSRLADDAVAVVEAFHRTHPLAPGCDIESIRTRLRWSVSPKVFRWVLERLVAARRLVREESTVRSPDHAVALSATGQTLAKRVLGLLEEGWLAPPDVRQLEAQAGATRQQLIEILAVLEGEGRAVRISPELYYVRAAAERACDLLAAHCRTQGEITAAVFRDLIGASRKYAIALLDWCDRTGVTIRVGDLRRLRR